ncbi:unknown protein [Seminavis robusta]|uniref:Uncharacterized protein n=1 Tax=Seminavis robusta TaxID=568900 RepID=A0A9N8DMH8_9STRA|nr:unknown protein [Seminavis robusta]|eukprot:Sro243_g096980.1 n/a (416) ;mRNA; r:67696-69070
MMLFEDPIHLLIRIAAAAASCAVDTTAFAFASTEFGAALFMFFAVARTMLVWGLSPQEAPQYVPKRLRREPAFLTRVCKTSIDAIKSVSWGVTNATLLMIELSHMAIMESAGIPTENKNKRRIDDDESFLDQGDDEDEPYAKICGRYRNKRYPVTLWEFNHSNNPHLPATTFQLFIRFLLILKGGLRMLACETNPITALQFIAFSLSNQNNQSAEDHQYDADSVLIAIDNCSSRCITNCMKDFIGKPTKVQVKVQGIGGTVTATYKGTVRWSIEDDDGMVHHFLIPDTYYNPSTPYRLLSPQHWARVADDNRPKQRGTWCATYEDSVELFWNQRSFKRMIPLSPSNNIAIVRSAPSFSKLHAFCSEIAPAISSDRKEQELDETELLCCPAVSVTDDESSVSSDGSDSEDDPESQW